MIRRGMTLTSALAALCVGLASCGGDSLSTTVVPSATAGGASGSTSSSVSTPTGNSTTTATAGGANGGTSNSVSTSTGNSTTTATTGGANGGTSSSAATSTGNAQPTAAPDAAASAPARPEKNADLSVARYVNPLIGTDYATLAPADPVGSGLGGGTFPGPTLPFGMMQWSPMTPTAQYDGSVGDGSGFSGGYWYGDKAIKGFSVLHLSGTGCWANGGYLNVMPKLSTGASSQTGFSHSQETAQAGYYGVTLQNGIKAEFTATARTGFARFTYPALAAGQQATIALDPTVLNNRAQGTTADTIRQVGDRALSGRIAGGGFCWAGQAVPVYYYAVFSKPFAAPLKLKNNQPVAATFAADAANPAVLMKLGISFVSEANAKANLDAENPDATANGASHWDFDGTRQAASAAWDARLNSIQVTGGSEADKTKFYTALYHASLHPNVFNDVNGQYPDFFTSSQTPPTRTVDTGRTMYANFSGWDIDRSFMQLQALLDPVRAGDMVQSLVKDGATCGALPRWAYFNTETGVMPGDAGSLIVANAYAFGVRNFDTATALSIMKSSTKPGANCAGSPTMGSRADFDTLGYVPSSGTSDDNQSASNTLEYALRDFAVSRFAAALGDTQTASARLASSGNWKNLFHDGSIQPKTAAGAWYTSGPGFMEGNAEQYTWYVLQNLGGLYAKIGSNASIVARLDTFFTNVNIGTEKPYFYAGNEVTFAIPWAYAWAGAPSHTQKALHTTLGTAFGAGPGGLPGNDDLGAVSAWYVWSALGLYPVVPGVGGLAVSSPQFETIDVRVGQADGSYRLLHITAPGTGSADSASFYVKSLRVGDAAYPSAWLPFSKISAGGTLGFEMTGDPASSTWGTDASTMPSFSDTPAR